MHHQKKKTKKQTGFGVFLYTDTKATVFKQINVKQKPVATSYTKP